LLVAIAVDVALEVRLGNIHIANPTLKLGRHGGRDNLKNKRRRKEGRGEEGEGEGEGDV